MQLVSNYSVVFNSSILYIIKTTFNVFPVQLIYPEHIQQIGNDTLNHTLLMSHIYFPVGMDFAALANDFSAACHRWTLSHSAVTDEALTHLQSRVLCTLSFNNDS